MIVITVKRINKIIIVFLVMTITVFSGFVVSAASPEFITYVSLSYGTSWDNMVDVPIECDFVESEDNSVLVKVRPKDELDFLLLIDKDYEFWLQLNFSYIDCDYIIFDDNIPFEYLSSSADFVSNNVFRLSGNSSRDEVYAFKVLDNVSELSFALSKDSSFVFPEASEPNGFLVFLSDVVILFEKSLDWFITLFSNISRSAPLLILVCGFLIVGFSFSLLRRVQR